MGLTLALRSGSVISAALMVKQPRMARRRTKRRAALAIVSGWTRLSAGSSDGLNLSGGSREGGWCRGADASLQCGPLHCSSSIRTAAFLPSKRAVRTALNQTAQL